MSRDNLFKTPNTGERYASHGDGIVAITEYNANRVESHKHKSDSVKFGMAIRSVGMGGESLVRKRVIPWNEYMDLDKDTREAAIASTETVVEPPGKWRLALKSGIVSWLWPHSHDAGTLLFHYKDVLWELDEYHPISDDARIIADIPDGHKENLNEQVSYKEPKAGQVYLNSHGSACIYSKIEQNSSLGCTRYKLSDVKPVLVDVDNTNILPADETKKYTSDRLSEFEWEHDNVWVQYGPDDRFERTVQTIFDTLIDPNSVAARLGQRQEWMNFGLSRMDDSYLRKVDENTNLPILSVLDDNTEDNIEDQEQEIRRNIAHVINQKRNGLMDSLRSYSRKYNL